MADDAADRLYVVYTMDCLPAGERGGVTGPDRWNQATGAMKAFGAALAALDLPGTFFVAPEMMGRAHRDVEAIAADGHEVGMLCHPQLSGFQAHLGAYGFDRQQEVLELGLKTWAANRDERPLAFRPGFFSANDYTYHVLVMLGFRQGSCSLPGRVDNDQASVWRGAFPYVHHTDPLDRLLDGSMEFLEVPVTSESGAQPSGTVETYTPPHLRLEEPDLHDYARDLVDRQLDLMEKEDALRRVITFVTSNKVGWGRSDDPHTDRLANLHGMLRDVAAERALTVHATTLADLHDEIAFSS